MNLLDQFEAKMLPFDDFFLEGLIAKLLILLLKQGARTPGVADNPTILKNVPGVLIGDLAILYLSGMEGKQDTKAVEIFVKIS
jgi:hypothetical protein